MKKLKLTKLGFRLPSPLLLEKLVREKKARDADKEPGGKKAEKVRKGAAQSYKNVGRKEKQMEQFPKLMEEIKKKEASWAEGPKWTAKQRFGPEYRAEMAKVVWDKIGGTEDEKVKFFDEVIAAYPDVYWMDGCPAPTVKNKEVHFQQKADAVPVARQPIPLSPYDDARVEFHIRENIKDGKLRQIRPDLGEPLPEWSTPVFVVDQDAKGLLGRLVCAYGMVNAAMELPTFPSADPHRAFKMAAGKAHHTLVDAIWGYTQFLLH